VGADDGAAGNLTSVDVGSTSCAGPTDEDGRLSGLLAVVNHFPGMPERSAPTANGAPDDYDRKIQTADISSPSS